MLELEKRAQGGSDALEALLVVLVEGGGRSRIDVEHGVESPGPIEDRYDNLGARLRIARNVPGKGVHVRHHNGLPLTGSCATDTSVEGNFEASKRPLIWTDPQELVLHHAVEAGPACLRKGMMHESGRAREDGHRIAHAAESLGQLRFEDSIGLCLVHGEGL